jgi:hypothetical protein
MTKAWPQMRERTPVASVSRVSFREFTDVGGREWRAWDIKPHEIHPATRAEDYLADCYVTGWIVFESVDGNEKRRLCPWPISWADEPVAGLRKLLSMAEVVPPHRLTAQRVSGEWEQPEAVTHEVAAQTDGPDVTDLHVVRTFRYPRGRVWTVSIVRPDDGGLPVLRFSAGDSSIDVKKWRKDWADLPNDALIWTLRNAAPRPEREPEPWTPRRRWDDQPLWPDL